MPSRLRDQRSDELIARNPDGQRQPLAVLPPLPVRPFVSVVVPALNEAAAIGACIESFAAQTYPHDLLEVIVADGGSSDGTQEIVAGLAGTLPIRVRLVHNAARRTPEGLNAGIAAASGAVIMIFGAHALAAPTTAAVTVEALAATGAAAAGLPIEARGEGRTAAAIAAALSHPFGVGDARFRFAKSSGYVDTIAFAGYRRECFDVLGGFSTDREKAEDDFFNHRVRKAGGRLYLDARATNVYFSRSNFDGLARQYFGYGRARARAAAADRESLRLRHVVPAAALVAGAGLVLLTLWSTPARVVLALLALVYGAGCVVAGVQAAGRRSPPLLTAVAFPVIHLSYGLGTLRGLVQLAATRRRQASP